MKNVTIETQREILKKTYLTIEDTYKLLPIGYNNASRLFREVEKECKQKGIPLFITRPRVVPTEMLIRKFPNLKKIRKEIL